MTLPAVTFWSVVSMKAESVLNTPDESGFDKKASDKLWSFGLADRRGMRSPNLCQHACPQLGTMYLRFVRRGDQRKGVFEVRLFLDNGAGQTCRQIQLEQGDVFDLERKSGEETTRLYGIGKSAPKLTYVFVCSPVGGKVVGWRDAPHEICQTNLRREDQAKAENDRNLHHHASTELDKRQKVRNILASEASDGGLQGNVVPDSVPALQTSGTSSAVEESIPKAVPPQRSAAEEIVPVVPEVALLLHDPSSEGGADSAAAVSEIPLESKCSPTDATSPETIGSSDNGLPPKEDRDISTDKTKTTENRENSMRKKRTNSIAHQSGDVSREVTDGVIGIICSEFGIPSLTDFRNMSIRTSNFKDARQVGCFLFRNDFGMTIAKTKAEIGLASDAYVSTAVTAASRQVESNTGVAKQVASIRGKISELGLVEKFPTTREGSTLPVVKATVKPPAGLGTSEGSGVPLDDVVAELYRRSSFLVGADTEEGNRFRQMLLFLLHRKGLLPETIRAKLNRLGERVSDQDIWTAVGRFTVLLQSSE